MSSSFADLVVWKKACRLAVKLYGLLKDSRDYGLRDQMQRAAVSVASNIAEGCERKSDAEFIRFLDYAKGSAAELRTQVYIAREVGALSKNDSNVLIDDVKEVSKMLQVLGDSLH
jgi:four helix bundle protein